MIIVPPCCSTQLRTAGTDIERVVIVPSGRLQIPGNGIVYRNLPVSVLVEKAVERREGILTDTGALCVNTGKYTGRSPKDKFIVDVPGVHEEIDWGEFNQPISNESFQRLRDKMLAYLQNRTLFVFEGFAGAEKESRIAFRVVTELAFQNLFAHQLLICPTQAELKFFNAEYTVLCAPGFSCVPEEDGVHSEAAIIIDFTSKTILIAGTLYCGEIKKAIFTVMNYELPRKGILTMHCSANKMENGETALFFGLSGTGKTTLSSSPDRQLVGDDEHGWSERGIFNLEGGCYAKCLGLERSSEPEIFDAVRFGTVLENVKTDENRTPDFNDSSLTPNTRAGYPLRYIANADKQGLGLPPSTIIFLTADAYGIIPPVSRLDSHGAAYHFLLGYTSKVAGTERGVTDPTITFSSMFGAPFFPLRPEVYLRLFLERLHKSGASVYLVNTGWCGGLAGEVSRISLQDTRSIVSAILAKELEHAEYEHDDIIGLHIPKCCRGLSSESLVPAKRWGNEALYRKMELALKEKFNTQMKKYEAALSRASV